MGSLGHPDNEIQQPVKKSNNTGSDFAPTDIHIQPFDSQILPGNREGDGDAYELQLEQNIVAFDDDTVLVDDAFETQVVNLGGETQVLDDPDCLENIGTEFKDEFKFTIDSDDEGTDGTEVLDDSDELSDGESGRRGKCESFSGEKIQYTSPTHGEKGLTDGQRSSGSTVSPETPVVQVSSEPEPVSVRRFTSVRAASVRASGLAARSTALKGTNSESCSLQTMSEFSEHTINNNGSKTKVWEESDQVCDSGRYDDEMKALRHVNKCKVSCTAVRKLFTEDFLVENKGLAYNSDETVGGKEAIQLPIFNNGLAGLSYIDSQEPGESSQVNALACVQKLIDENKVLFDSELSQGKCSRRKSNHISTAKGTQRLAKKANDRGTNGKTGIFDWDDRHEDEGGGDIFCRRKEEFFGSGNLGQRSFMKPQKPKGKSNVQNERMVCSDSKIVSHNLKIHDRAMQETNMNIRKTLVNEFNEQSNNDALAGLLDTTLTRKDVPEMLNVGLDTQMAAEAMEALFHGEGISNYDTNNAHLGLPGNSEGSLKRSPRRKAKKSVHSKKGDIGVVTRQSKKAKGIKSSKQSSISPQKHSNNVMKECDTDLVITRRKRVKLDAEKLSMPSKNIELRSEGSTESRRLDEFDRFCGTATKGGCSVKKRLLVDTLTTFTPIAHRTRQSLAASQLKGVKNVPSDCGQETNCPMEVGVLEENRAGTIVVEASNVLNAKMNSSELGTGQSGDLDNFKPKLTGPRGKRSHRNFSGQINELDNINAQSKPSGQPRKSMSELRRSWGNTRITSADLNMRKKTRLSTSACQDLSSINQNFKELSAQNVNGLDSGDDGLNSNSADMIGKQMSKDQMGAKATKFSDGKIDADSLLSAENEVNVGAGRMKPYESACNSPANSMTCVNAVSPICMGSGYLRQSFKKNLSRSCLMREINSLCATGPEPISITKDSRKRRDLANVQVLFSQHLDEDIIKQQRKIVDRLKVSIASSITDATHFITDKFVRTRNMLEAIASGKPVVTHLWLENVGRANYYIDEEKYILRDMKKEKEFGFNMPVSLAHARQHPLLQGRRVLITPNTKPGKETILSLVKAVHGQPAERIGRSAMKDGVVPDDLLILSCEEDYEVCVPFLEKGAAVYSSELLLNGIVTQKLEYERHLLFADHVKRTRSTIWLKKDGHNFIPVAKNQ